MRGFDKKKIIAVVSLFVLTGILMWNTGLYSVMASDCVFHKEITEKNGLGAQSMAGNGNTLYLLKTDADKVNEENSKSYIIKIENANTNSPKEVFSDNKNGIGVVHGNGMTYYNGNLYIASGGSAKAIYRIQETNSSIDEEQVHYIKNKLTVSGLKSGEDIRNIAHYSGNYFIICLLRKTSGDTTTLTYGIGLLSGTTMTIQKRFIVVATDTYESVQDIEYHDGELWIVLHYYYKDPNTNIITRKNHIHIAEIPTSYSEIIEGSAYPVKKTVSIDKNESGFYNDCTNELESVYINEAVIYTWSNIRGNKTAEVFCRDTCFSNITEKYTLDLNGYLGTDNSAGNISGYGTANVYINGYPVVDENNIPMDLMDYCVAWKRGTTYEINNIKTESGKYYYGVTEGSLTGTLTKDTSVRLHFGTMCTDGTQTVPDGTYVIVSALDGRKVLDVEDAGTANETNLQLATYRGLPSQAFYIKYQGDGYYSITDTNSGLSPHVLHSGTTNGTNVIMWNSETGYNGQWVIKDAGSGYYHIITHCSSMYLDVANAGTADGTNIQIVEANGNDAQKFALVPYYYTVTYNANGGSGEPEPQTKIYGISLALSGTVPQREGYTFQGWSYSPDGTAVYAAGSDYPEERSVTLYAVWAQEGSPMAQGYGKLLPEGDYVIACAADRGYQLDIGGDVIPTNAGEVVQVWPRSDPERVQDVFTLAYHDDGFYTISQRGTDMAVDVPNGSSTTGGYIQMYYYNDAIAQRWTLSRAYNIGAGYYIQAKCSGWVLRPGAGMIETGKGIEQARYSEDSTQGWVFIPYMPEQPVEEGRYILVSAVDTAYELDVAGDTADVANETNVQIWYDESEAFRDLSLSQYNSFDLVALDNGYYKLVHAASGKVLDVSGGTAYNAQNIWMYEDNGGGAQQWAITPQGDGYMLRARCSGLALDLADGITQDGQNIQQVYYNGSAAQTWLLVPAEHTVSYDLNDETGRTFEQTKYYKGRLVLSAEEFTREGYIFSGWNTEADGSGTAYQAGGFYDTDEDMVLYAQWAEVLPLPGMSADIEELPEGPFTLTVEVENAGADSMVYVACYDEQGQMISVRSADIREGETEYPFTIEDNPHMVKIFLLDRMTQEPLIEELIIKAKRNE